MGSELIRTACSSPRDRAVPRVVLCAPNTPKRPGNLNRLYTLALLYLKNAARQAGWECDLVDAYFSDLTRQETVARILARGAPGLLGFCLHSPSMLEEALGIIQILECQLGRTVPVVVGGHYATHQARELLEAHDRIHYVIEGEGEGSLRALLTALGQGGIRHAVPGLRWREENGEICGDQPRSLGTDLDELGNIDFDWIDEDMGPADWSLVASRGCCGRCSFCAVGPLWGASGRWRGHSPEWFVARVEELVRNHGASRIIVVDDNFLGGPAPDQRAAAIAALMRQKKIHVPFSVMVRADTVCACPRAFVELQEVGLHHVLLGLESGDDAILARLNKGTTRRQGEEATAILDGLDITVTAGTIVFHPWMTRESIRTDLEFLNRLMEKNLRCYFLGLNELDIISGTPIASEYAGDTWRREWKAADPAAQEVYDRWRLIQGAVLFPAMRLAPPEAGLGRRRAYAFWQLESLGLALEGGATLTREDLFSATQASMCKFLLAQAGRETLERFLEIGTSPRETVDRIDAHERCFL